MFTIVFVIGALAVAAIAASVVQFSRDGYRRIPTRFA
jgi:hypothetical protein